MEVLLKMRKGAFSTSGLHNHQEVLMSVSNYRWQHRFHDLQLITHRLQLNCVPLEDLFRTIPGVKSTQVGLVKETEISQTCSKSNIMIT